MIKDENYIDALNVLEINPDHLVSNEELKRQYRILAKCYHPDTCTNSAYKDGNMFNVLKESYDLLNNDINLTNSVIDAHINGRQYFSQEANQNEYAYGGYNGQAYNYGFRGPNIKIMDRPSIMTMILCLFLPFIGILNFAITRKVAPKAAYSYLVCSLIGLVLTFVLNYMTL